MGPGQAIPVKPADIWFSAPGDEATVRLRIGELVKAVRQYPNDDPVTEAALNASENLDHQGLIHMGHQLLSIPALADLGRGFLWAAASLGNEHARARIARELSTEASLPSPRRNMGFLGNLTMLWLTLSNNQSAPELRRAKGRAMIKALADRNEQLSQVQHQAAPDDCEDGLIDDEAGEREPSVVDLGNGGMVVAKVIGDRNSREGREVVARYGHIIGKPLPYRGALIDPDRIHRELLAQFPWAENTIRYISGQMSLLRSAAQSHFFLPPLMLVGPPGCGKTTLLERLCKIIGAASQTLPCGGTSDTGGLAAVIRGWSTSRASAPVTAMAEFNCANPVLILDELDKGSLEGSKNGSVVDASLAMVQNPREYYDGCLLSNVDISRVTFLASVNDLRLLPDALRDRFIIFPVPRPRPEHFDLLIKGVRQKEAERLGIPEQFMPWLSRTDQRWLKNSFEKSGCSIRALEQAHRLVAGERAAEENEMQWRPN
jgi:hypothetical protein